MKNDQQKIQIFVVLALVTQKHDIYEELLIPVVC